MSGRSCDRCLSDGADDEGEPEVICHTCQADMADTFKGIGATATATAEAIAAWLEHGLADGSLTGRTLHELAEAIRAGAWKP